MKLLLGCIFMLVSVNVCADDCLVSNVKTKGDVEVVQDCIIKQLTELDNLLGSICEYHVRVKSQLTNLINEEAICKKQELIAKANLSNRIYQALVDGCKASLADRQEKFIYISDEYQKMEPRIKKIEVKKQELDFLYKRLPSS